MDGAKVYGDIEYAASLYPTASNPAPQVGKVTLRNLHHENLTEALISYDRSGTGSVTVAPLSVEGCTNSSESVPLIDLRTSNLNFSIATFSGNVGIGWGTSNQEQTGTLQLGNTQDGDKFVGDLFARASIDGRRVVTDVFRGSPPGSNTLAGENILLSMPVPEVGNSRFGYCVDIDMTVFVHARSTNSRTTSESMSVRLVLVRSGESSLQSGPVTFHSLHRSVLGAALFDAFSAESFVVDVDEDTAILRMDAALESEINNSGWSMVGEVRLLTTGDVIPTL